MIFSTWYTSVFYMIMRSRVWPRLCIGIFTCCLRLNALIWCQVGDMSLHPLGNECECWSPLVWVYCCVLGWLLLEILWILQWRYCLWFPVVYLVVDDRCQLVFSPCSLSLMTRLHVQNCHRLCSCHIVWHSSHHSWPMLFFLPLPILQFSVLIL